MTENIFLGLLLLIIIGLMVYIHHLQQQMKNMQEMKYFYNSISSSMGLLTVSYDVKNDVVELSHDCSSLLELPSRITDFSSQKEAALADRKNPLYPIASCLGAYQEEQSWMYYRRGRAPRQFALQSYILNDINGSPYYVLGLMRDVTKQANETARLAAKAQFDGLTHVHNSSATRSWMKDHVGRRSGGMMFLLDVDHFKGVNDTIGHQGGDQALICVANALRQSFAGQGFIGRLGGDEFIAYLDSSDREAAESFAQSIHENATRLGRESGLGIELTVSIGCALLTDEDYEAAYKYADQALYQAKESGRNTHVILPSATEPAGGGKHE